MKKVIVAISIIVVVSACSKGSSGSSIIPTSTLGLITAKQWINDTLYSNYTGTPGSGTLVYARGSAGNTYNLDNEVFIYWPDGNADILNPPNSSVDYFSEPWSFIGADSTELFYPATPMRSFAVYQRILRLDETHFNLYDSTDHSLVILKYLP